MTKINLLVMAMLTLLIASCSKPTTNETTTEETSNIDASPQSITALTLSELQKDPDVLWIGEVMVDYAPNFHSWTSSKEEQQKMEKAGFKGKTAFKILKYQVTDLDKSGNEDHFLTSKILKNTEDIKLYKDDVLSERYSESELKEIVSSLDTIITFDPQTYEEVIQIIRAALEPDDVNFFRMKQLVYYSKKDITFKVVPLSIALMADQSDSEGKDLGSQPLFWMNVSFMEEAPNLSSESITWAKRIHRAFDLKDVKILKEEQTFAAVIETFAEDVRKKSDKVYVAHTFDADGNQKMTKEELENLGSSIDTIITFHPKTFDQIVQVVKNELDGEDIQSIRLMQDWFWNEESKELAVRYAGFKPIINRVDDKGNFLNSGPMLIRRPDRDGE